MTHEAHQQPIDHTVVLTAYHQAFAAWQEQPSLITEQVLTERARALDAAFVFLPGEFELGALVATPGALHALDEAQHLPSEFLIRHKHGDFGEMDPEDLAENERAIREGSRVFSAYSTRLDQKLWCITEWDRSVTTLLLPEEY